MGTASAALFDSLVQDLRFAWRSFRGDWAFAVIALLTTAVAIASATTVFSVVEAVLLRPLPYREPDRLFALNTVEARTHRALRLSSYPDVADWQAQSRAFQAIAAFRGSSRTLTGRAEPERVEALEVSPSLFRTLGVAPVLGRTFTGSDGGQAVVLGHALWMRSFGGDHGAIGQDIRLDNERYVVVGVLPPDFHFPPARVEAEPEIFLALVPQLDRDIFSVEAVGRLAPGVDEAQAQLEMRLIAERLDVVRPANRRGRGILIAPLGAAAARGARPVALLLLGAVACVLVVACANVAHLLLARGTTRRAELAIRASLGATRARLARQLLTESLLLSLAGGALGVLLARWCLPLLAAFTPPRSQLFTRLHDAGLQVNGSVLAFACLASLLSGVFFGLVPALRSTGAAGLAGARATGRLRGLLVLTEVALALVLVAGAGLMTRTVGRLIGDDTGLRTDRIWTAVVSLPETKYSEPSQRAAFFRRVLPGVSRLPGVEGAALVVHLPLTRSDVTNSVEVEGGAIREGRASYDSVSPGYFGTIGMTIVRGRAFTEADSEATSAVAIVNQAMARRFWPGGDPIGKAILATRAVVERTPAGSRLRFVQDRCDIVGVVSDAKQLGLDAPPLPAVFFPFSQRPSSEMTIVARSSGDPVSLREAVAREVRRADADLPLTDVRTMDEWIDREVAPRRFVLFLLGSFALVAAVLGAVGIYGVGAFSVSRRVREIGVRLALGASRGSIAAMILQEHAWWVAGGVAAGLAAAWGTTRLLTAHLYGVTPTDPESLAAAAGLLLAAAALAQAVPVARAVRVKPAEALRHE